MKHTSNSTKETAEIAKKLASRISRKDGPCVIGLSGELGAGKTTFAKNFAKALGVKETVKSPTYILMRKHEIRNPKSETNSKFKKNKFKTLYHLDVYRINNTKEILDLDWKDLIKDKNNIILVEWAENIKKAFPKTHFWLNFEHAEKNKRKIEVLDKN